MYYGWYILIFQACKITFYLAIHPGDQMRLIWNVHVPSGVIFVLVEFRSSDANFLSYDPPSIDNMKEKNNSLYKLINLHRILQPFTVVRWTVLFH